ncbi:hypothetical protein ARALYDRAFT_915512 [Arabidopsis lyrata subsp. lyrata]|uniref:FKB95-like N-terminal Kelch domain-containing protein n=2 Tax=Arabidopsis lyrata subsp. lyrata TaxID=81972 RepID=D7MH94_ARALL|nr:hypothetical protein ARALYDRAFT_915512 [Arabidopsis lyrata subsp. lyrata]
MKKKKVCGLWSLPDAVVVNCLAQLSRLDFAALAIASKNHRSLVVSPELRDLRWQQRCMEPSLYVCLRIFPEPSPRWFILHPMQRWLKPIHMDLYQAPKSASSFVVMGCGICIIGGLVDGKPTSEVSFFDCFEHRWYRMPPMKMARASASASLMTDSKIYVFGGCGDDVANSSNWAEVFDVATLTWDFLYVFTPKMPLNIQQSVVMIKEKEVYVVDEDGQNFSFSPSKCMFVARGKTDSIPGNIYRNDWCVIGTFLFCRGTRGRILWCLPYELHWKEVKGLEELQQWGFDITKLCTNPAGNIVIFWKPHPLSLELWSIEISISLVKRRRNGREILGKIEWSGAVFKLDPLIDSSYSLKVLSADYVLA